MADNELESKEQDETSRKSKNDENVLFYFLYDINKRNILRRQKIGGKYFTLKMVSTYYHPYII